MNNQNNNMATASMIMGILAMVLVCCYGGLLFGGLGILFAILSRTEERMSGQARAGLILSVIALVVDVLLIAAVFLLAWNSGGWGHGPVENLPAYPEIPDIPIYEFHDNELWNLPAWIGGWLI